MSNKYDKTLHQAKQLSSGFVLALQHQNATGQLGSRLGRRTGSSLEFMEHRDYQAGDDLRTLDWSVYARSNNLAVKVYRDEISPKLDILIDNSYSMSINESKAQATMFVAGFFTALALNNSYAIKSFKTTEIIEPILNGSQDSMLWDSVEFNSPHTPEEALQNSVVNQFQPHGVRFLVSDLLWEGNPTAVLRKLANGASRLVIVQVLSKEDISPTLNGNVRMVDSETAEHEELFIDSVEIDRYRQAFNAHQGVWIRSCREFGATLVTVVAEELISSHDLKPFWMANLIRSR